MDSRRRHVLGRRLGAITQLAARALGHVGRRLGTPEVTEVPVSAAVLRRLDTVTPQQSLEDVAHLLVSGRNTQVPMVDHGQAVGVVTRDDVAIGLRRNGPRAPVSAAPRHDAVTVTPSDSLSDVLERLRASPGAVAVVIDQGVAVGLLTFDSLVAYVEGHSERLQPGVA